ncbi:CDP-diacylglycerol--glycerol-3-phosphate 3-phosphatidyltransferase [Undibacterium sp. GrIS 1.8]|uniref:CDP-alcohol phosphatidyltransferase family protein n=1 Tax=unclassified Undibacterium TaxID=2630295 RepID=UPI003392CC12
MKLSIYQLKPQFQRLLAPFLKTLINRRISPNQITLLTMSLSVLFGMSLVIFPNNPALWIAFPFFMLLRMALNAIDGMLANVSGQKTALGALLNEICDQVSDVALYLPFALLFGMFAPLVILVVVAALLTEFAGVIAVLIGQPRRFDGPMGKSDRAFCFSLIAVFIDIKLAPIWINSLLSIVLFLLIVTIFNRLQQALQQHRQTVQLIP